MLFGTCTHKCCWAKEQGVRTRSLGLGAADFVKFLGNVVAVVSVL